MLLLEFGRTCCQALMFLLCTRCFTLDGSPFLVGRLLTGRELCVGCRLLLSPRLPFRFLRSPLVLIFFRNAAHGIKLASHCSNRLVRMTSLLVPLHMPVVMSLVFDCDFGKFVVEEVDFLLQGCRCSFVVLFRALLAGLRFVEVSLASKDGVSEGGGRRCRRRWPMWLKWRCDRCQCFYNKL